MVSKATRRGPMDEMRQLVRILVKIIPHSVTFLASAEEGGGGNRISEERIKYFLDSTLGEAPRPAWGVPQGWGEYLAGEDTLRLHMDQAVLGQLLQERLGVHQGLESCACL